MSELKQRNYIIARVNRYLNNVQNPDPPLNYYSASSLLEQVKLQKMNLDAVHSTLVDLTEDQATIDAHETVYSQEEAKYLTIVSTLNQVIASSVPPPPQQPTTIHHKTVKLPTLELPSFDGEYPNWPSFKDLFKARIGDNTELSGAQKLQYLRSALKEKPAGIIKAITITDSNFQEAWKLLSSRYENEREIVFSLISKLLNQKPVQVENAIHLQQLVDSTNEILQQLTVMNRQTGSWDDLLVVIVQSKLDPNTRREWAVSLKTNAIPTFKELEVFLQNHIRGLMSTTTTAPGKPRVEKFARAHHVSSSSCPFCKEEHFGFQCPMFTSKTAVERIIIAKKARVCFNCLQQTNPPHMSKDCKNKYTCKKCNHRHHTLLHLEKRRAGNRPGSAPPPNSNINQPAVHHAQPQSTQPTTTTTQPPPPPATAPAAPAPLPLPSTSATCGHVEAGFTLLLATALIKIQDNRGRWHPCRILLDSGSGITLISEAMANLLGFRRSYSKIKVRGIGGVQGGVTNGKFPVGLTSRYHPYPTVTVEVHVLPQLTNELPTSKCKVLSHRHLQADPTYNQPSGVDLIIGIKDLPLILEEGLRKGPIGSPIAQLTTFGWVLYGPAELDGDVATINRITIEEILQKFWITEELPTKSLLTKEEKECERFFTATTTRDDDGRFVVRVPFNNQVTALGLSRSMAIKRLQAVEKRLYRHPQQRIQYNEFMDQYLALGHMERVPVNDLPEIEGKSYYLPHHCVVNKDSTTTKLRVVFDGSFKTTTGLSLNQCMLVGPTVQPDLLDILLRFRMHQVVLKADITKMYRQFRLHPDDANYHKIVWRSNPHQPIVDYRLITVTYGTASAPYLATRCVKQLGIENATATPTTAKTLQEDIYVDDVLTGAATTQAAIQLYKELNTICNSAQLKLCKWASNSKEVMQEIPTELHDTDPASIEKETLKALGVQWAPLPDVFIYKYQPQPTEGILTKRKLLSNIAKVFDPLGLISPITVRGKLLLQQLWKIAADWDEPIPDYIYPEWKSYEEDLNNISSVIAPRCLIPANSTIDSVHGFCDASERAFGAAVYLKSISQEGRATVNLILSKSRVAPLRQITLPRLELQGALVLAEDTSYVMDTLKLDCGVHLWTDSTITLNWIQNQSKRWKTFVANRVATIQEIIKTESWNHVPGLLNPADLVSRGVEADELINSNLWWKGPQFIYENEHPVFNAPVPSDLDQEERQCNIAVSPPQLLLPSYFDKYSTLSTLIRVTAFIFRFANSARKLQIPPLTKVLSTAELQNALAFHHRRVQQEHFPEDLKNLKRKKPVQPNSKLKSLYPYIDHQGVLRVTGRISNAQMSENAKHQVILPKDSHFTNLVLHNHHYRNLHSGFQLTWASIRQQYWILGGRDKVRNFIRNCVTCCRYQQEKATQLMGSLPPPRTTPNRPFLHTGVDYAGPYTLKNPVGRAPKTYKGYICLFVCFSTKAIHLELASSLSTADFIVCLRRFVARRGLCSHLYSDCGTNFIGAEKEIKRLFLSEEHNQQVGDVTSSLGITWKFNVPAGPHFGGLWEAGVKSTKFHLRRVLGTTPHTYEQLLTFICQVEAVLNSRPLYAMSSEPDDLQALTPGHFLIGEPLNAIPDDVPITTTSFLNQYRSQQQRIKQFWIRWQKEYLHTLQQRTKWMWLQEDVQVGDLVIITEETAPALWKLGRVIAIHINEADKFVRSVTVKTSNTTLDRPITKLIPLKLT